jgi:tetratricopeptide (TPR) repeat protein
MTHWSNIEYDLALTEFCRSLEIREDINGKYDDDTSKSYLWVGSVHWSKENHERALDCFCRAFRIRLAVTGSKEHCGIVTNWISKVLEAKQVDKDAYWKQIMSAVEREGKGDKLSEEGKFDRAILEYRAALQLEQRRRQSKSTVVTRPVVDAADLYVKIGRMYMALTQHDRALFEFRNALSIYLAKFGRHHRYTEETYDDIYAAAKEKGWVDSVVEEYLESLYDSIVFEKNGDMLNEQRDYVGASREYEQALKLEEGGMGKLHLPSAALYSKLAKIYAGQGNKDQALYHCCIALGIYDAALGSHHRLTITTNKMIKALFLEEPQA